MKKKKATLFAVLMYLAVVVCVFIEAEFYILKLDWDIHCLVFYCVLLPVTALASLIIVGKTKCMLKWGIPFIYGYVGCAVPYFSFSGVGWEFFLNVFLPSAIGLIIGSVIGRLRKKSDDCQQQNNHWKKVHIIIVLVCVLPALLAAIVTVASAAHRWISERPEGTKIEIVNIDYEVDGYTNNKYYFIDNAEELREVVSPRTVALFNAYDESFFEEHDLLAISFETNSAYGHEVTDVYLNEGTLDVYFDEMIEPKGSAVTMIGVGKCIFIEIPKQNLEDDTTVKVHFNQVHRSWFSFLN